jgi:membrane-associated phospholipid phosphatase
MAPGRDTQTLRRRTDVLIAGYLLTTALLLAAFHDRVPQWEPWVLAHLVLSGLIAALSFLPTKLSVAPRLLRDWYPVLLLPLLFKEVEMLAAGFGNWGLTVVLQNLEVAWFGGHPSLYLSELLPWIPLSEYLHFCYFAYLLLVPSVGSYWYFTGQKGKFHELVFLVSVTLTVSYLFFALFPVDSPFYVFPPLGAPFEGRFFYDLVHFVSGHGGARGGAFPSSHVSVAMVVLLVLWRRERPLALALLPIILGLILATVYGRFHYALDVVAGVALAATVVGAFTASAALRQGFGLASLKWPVDSGSHHRVESP